MTRAELNIAWCEAHLHLPEGRFVGQPLDMAEFMRDDFRAIYDNPHGTRRAIISPRPQERQDQRVRVHLAFASVRPRASDQLSQMFSCAQSRDQAAVLFSLAAKIVRLSPKLQPVIQIRDTAKELLCPALGTFYKALSRPKLRPPTACRRRSTVFDELGQERGPRARSTRPWKQPPRRKRIR